VEVWQAIDSLRVVREFDGRPLPEGDVERIVHAGRRTGSSKNLQEWGFLVIKERDRLQRLGQAGPWAGHVAGAAMAIALVTPDPHQPGQRLSLMWDLGRAAQNMILAAWDLGIGSCPATVYEHEVVNQVLELPDDEHCEFMLSFGYPADASLLTAPKRAGGRVPLSQVIHQEVW
jgi:nitroreductase